METSPFFQKLWRFNAIIIALAGLAGLLLLVIGTGAVGYEIYKDLTRQKRDQVITSTTPAEVAESLELGDMERVNGHNILTFSLLGEQRLSGGFVSYSKGESRSTRNYLFVDLKTNRSHWLLPNHKNLLLNRTYYPMDYGDEELPVEAIGYEIVYHDSDGNQRLNDEDQITLAFSTPQGTGLTNVIEGVDFIIGKRLLEEKILVVSYHKGGKTLLSRIDLGSFNILSTQELATDLPAANETIQPTASP